MLAHENRLNGDTTPVKPHIRAWQKQISDRIAFNRFMLSLEIPLTHSAIPTLGTVVPSFTRADATPLATFRDWEGVQRTVPSGCARFEGARMVRNLLALTESLTTAATWTKINGGAGSAPVVTAGFTDPDGGSTAFRLQASSGGVAGADYSVLRQTISAAVANGRRSIYIKSNTASSQNVYFGIADGTSVITATTSWQRLSNLKAVSSALFDIGAYNQGSGDANTTVDVLIWHPQLEDVTGQADQSASEYVSVGVLSSPWHGAGVDGVEFFNTDRDGALLPSAYTYDAVSLNGVAGTYVSTPDSVANSDTGSKDMRFKLFNSNWATGGVLTHRNSNNIQFDTFGGGGLLRFAVNHSAVTAFATSDVSPTTVFANNATGWLRVTYDTTSGEVLFYTSSDGAAWTQLGTAQSLPTGAIDEPAGVMSLGSDNVGTNPMPSCRIYQAQIYNGIDGTLAVDFDASRYAGSTTLTGSTGETWTLQGNAVIHPTNSPNTGYLAEGSRENKYLQSNAFTTAPWGNDLDVISQNAIGPDGATSAWTATDSSAVAARFFQAGTMTLTAAPWTASIFVKKTSGATSFPVSYMVTGSSVSTITIDTNNGVATPWTAYTGATIVPCTAVVTSFNADYWRVAFTFTATAVAWAFTVYVAATTNATQSTGTLDVTVTGSAVFYGAQIELGSSASSLINTTTAAVTRAADVLTYPSAGNLTDANGSAYCEYSSSVVDGNYGTALSGTGSGAGRMITHFAATSCAINDGTSELPKTGLAAINTGTRKRASTWSAAPQLKVTGDGLSPTTFGAYDGVIAPTSIAIGHRGSFGEHINGPIRNVRIWQRALSSSELQAITR
jgi:hypothetical protein